MLRLSALAVTAALFLGGTPPEAADGPQEVTVMSNEQYEQMLSSQARPSPPCVAAPQTDSASFTSAAPSWATAKLDSDGRRGELVPARAANGKPGWNHFYGPPNIADPNAVKKILGALTAYCRKAPLHRLPDKANQP
ncbi:hypothetical protein [Streptomyces sp. NPDC002825]|uniref:hypothetical protein n=1 Tax=Streptomyces sp. NPDC002825 TaxID=3154666 RepID=UPI00331EC233